VAAVPAAAGAAAVPAVVGYEGRILEFFATAAPPHWDTCTSSKLETLEAKAENIRVTKLHPRQHEVLVDRIRDFDERRRALEEVARRNDEEMEHGDEEAERRSREENTTASERSRLRSRSRDSRSRGSTSRSRSRSRSRSSSRSRSDRRHGGLSSDDEA
jgi:hypothetical protein